MRNYSHQATKFTVPEIPKVCHGASGKHSFSKSCCFSLVGYVVLQIGFDLRICPASITSRSP